MQLHVDFYERLLVINLKVTSVWRLRCLWICIWMGRSCFVRCMNRNWKLFWDYLKVLVFCCDHHHFLLIFFLFFLGIFGFVKEDKVVWIVQYDQDCHQDRKKKKRKEKKNMPIILLGVQSSYCYSSDELDIYSPVDSIFDTKLLGLVAFSILSRE